MKKSILLTLITIISISCKSTSESDLIITPITHETAVFTSGDNTVFIDPTGKA